MKETTTGETMRREAEVDERLADIWSRTNQIGARLGSIRISLAHAAGIRSHYEGRVRVTPGTIDENLAAAKAKAAPWDLRRVEEYEAEIAALRAERSALLTEAHPLETEYEAAPWSRFFLVNNAGGHIHSSMTCQTCNNGRDMTSFSWLPTLSGLTEADAVAEHGAILCTVCFPSAPVEWTNAHEIEREAREATYCTGTPEPGTISFRGYNNRYGEARCTDCGGHYRMTAAGKLRKHKPVAS